MRSSAGRVYGQGEQHGQRMELEESDCATRKPRGQQARLLPEGHTGELTSCRRLGNPNFETDKSPRNVQLNITASAYRSTIKGMIRLKNPSLEDQGPTQGSIKQREKNRGGETGRKLEYRVLGSLARPAHARLPSYCYPTEGDTRLFTGD